MINGRYIYKYIVVDTIHIYIIIYIYRERDAPSIAQEHQLVPIWYHQVNNLNVVN
jgi:hypothetical protein